jgi:AraC family transcriptional regulator
MLRYVLSGTRNYKTYPDVTAKRLNWEFFALTKGSLRPIFSDQRIKSPRNCNFWVIPPGIEYVWQADSKTCQRTVIHFAYTPGILAEEMTDKRIIALHLTKQQLRRVQIIAHRLMEHFRKPDQFSLLVIEHAVIELTMLALKDVKSRPQSTLANLNHERVERAIAWYSEHMHSQPSLEQVASTIHISPSHMRKLFYEAMQASPKTVFIKMKLQRACDILATTSSTLDQVASQCGFLSTVDLCRVFKKFHSISPGAWRRSISTVDRTGLR